MKQELEASLFSTKAASPTGIWRLVGGCGKYMARRMPPIWGFLVSIMAPFATGLARFCISAVGLLRTLAESC